MINVLILRKVKMMIRYNKRYLLHYSKWLLNVNTFEWYRVRKSGVNQR